MTLTIDPAMRTIPTIVASFVASLLLVSPALAAPQAGSGSTPPAPPSPVDRRAVADAVAPGLVRVEIRVKEDRGELPDWIGSPRLTGSGMGRGGPESGTQLIEEERPFEVPGYLLAPDLVLAHDPEIPARFIASIKVRHGTSVSDATPSGWLADDAGVFLTLAKPLDGTTPLAFAEKPADAKPARRFAIHWAPGDGDWSLVVADPSDVLDMETPDGAKRTKIDRSPDTLHVDEKGRVLGLWLIGRADVGGERPADPRTWKRIDGAAMSALLKGCADRADASVLHTTLHFRSPRKNVQRGQRFGGDEHNVATEQETLAVLLADGRLLVLSGLDPKATARLEKIEVHDAAGAAHEAKFIATLRDWGAFVAQAPASLSGGVKLSARELVDLRDALLPRASVRIVGRSRVNDASHLRLLAFAPGFRNMQFPMVISQSESAFLFSESGEVLAVPLSTRRQPGQRETWRTNRSLVCGSTVIAGVLKDLDAQKDPSNVPLSEDEESRTGWLGVMLQPLDPELARANGVAELTRDGQFGGLVTYIYPDSPAAKAGLELGDILLSVRTERRQKPIEIEVGPADMGYPGVFPWERLSDLPEEYYDQVPAPWPLIEDTVARTLTELGIGSSYDLDYVHNGAKQTKHLEVTQSPPHYGNAPKFESKDLGVTVRDLTMEVRQYLQLDPSAPGVVVAKLEPGQRASVAGLRPLEVITHVDDEPVKDAADFGRLIEGKNDIKLTVKRAAQERVVRVSTQEKTGVHP